MSEAQIGETAPGEAVDTPGAVGLALLMSDAEAAIAAAAEEIAMLSRAVVGGLASLPKLLGTRPPEPSDHTVNVVEAPVEASPAAVIEAVVANAPVTSPSGIKQLSAAVPDLSAVPASLVPPSAAAVSGHDVTPARQATLPVVVSPGEAVMPAAVPVSSLVPAVAAKASVWSAVPPAPVAPAPATITALPEPDAAMVPPAFAAPLLERLQSASASPAAPPTPAPVAPNNASPDAASPERTDPAPVDYAAFAPAPVGPQSAAANANVSLLQQPIAQAINDEASHAPGANAPTDAAPPASWSDAVPEARSFSAPPPSPAQTSSISLAPSPRTDTVQNGASHGGPTHGDVFLDGTRVGHWMSEALARAVSGPSRGCTAFDPTMSAAWPGALQGR